MFISDINIVLSKLSWIQNEKRYTAFVLPFDVFWFMKSSEQGVCWLVGETPLRNAKKSFISVSLWTCIEKSFQLKKPSSSDTQVQL